MRVLVFILCLFVSHAGATELDHRGDYLSVDLRGFVKENQISQEMAEKKQRLIKQPKAISFEATLVTQPKKGDYSLAYDALSLWDDGELPVINHSAFVGFADGGPVLGVYVTEGAERILRNFKLDKPAVFYAVHIYTYAKGPRLVIVAAEAL